MDAVQARLRGLLTEIAIVLKGPNDPRDPHDWGDLPDLAEKIVTEHKHLKAWWSDHMAKVADGYDHVADHLETIKAESEAAGYRRGVVDTIHRFEGRVRALPEGDAVDPDAVL